MMLARCGMDAGWMQDGRRMDAGCMHEARRMQDGGSAEAGRGRMKAGRRQDGGRMEAGSTRLHEIAQSHGCVLHDLRACWCLEEVEGG